MEAIAKHDFNATADDELSFRKSQVLKVCIYLYVSKYFKSDMVSLNMRNKQNWFWFFYRNILKFRFQNCGTQGLLTWVIGIYIQCNYFENDPYNN